MELGSLFRRLGLSNSATRPAFSTSTRSESMMVLRRWATVMTVQWAKAVRIVSWMSLSVCGSTDDVASSSTSTRWLRARARARQSSCFSPMDSDDSPSSRSSGVFSSPASLALATMVSFRWQCSSASSILSSGTCLNGSMFSRTEPLKSTGSCGIAESFERSDSSGIVDVSTPSMRSFESLMSGMSRNSVSSSELLPLPVRPQTPIFSPPLIATLTSLSTSGWPGRYCA
mmetsp:Transcript_17831/g.55334  ORF Transcript_17831/g.55334 Transcript_17831/m.55334 type:complete len:229 (-) Transcript_17831:1683-2369(-)